MHATTIWSGLAIGSIYSLVALQFDLVYACTRIFNFAQTGVLVVAALASSTLLAEWAVPWVVVLVIMLAGGAAVGVMQEILTVRPLTGRGEHDAHAWIVTTLGVGSILQGIAVLVWGSDPRRVPFPGKSTALSVFGGQVLPVDLALIAVAIVVTVGLRLALSLTRSGVATMATAADRELAMLRGINVGRVQLVAFGVAGALIAAGALVIAPITFASVAMGQRLVVVAFVALAVGGFGTQLGALLGGLAVGLVESISTYMLGSDEAQLIIFGLLLAVLLSRPGGIFSGAKARVV